MFCSKNALLALSLWAGFAPGLAVAQDRDAARKSIGDLNQQKATVEKLANDMSEASKSQRKLLEELLAMVGKNPSGWVLEADQTTKIPMTRELLGVLWVNPPPSKVGGDPVLGAKCTPTESCVCWSSDSPVRVCQAQ